MSELYNRVKTVIIAIWFVLLVAMVFEIPNKIPEKEPDISLMFTK